MLLNVEVKLLFEVFDLILYIFCHSLFLQPQMPNMNHILIGLLFLLNFRNLDRHLLNQMRRVNLIMKLKIVFFLELHFLVLLKMFLNNRRCQRIFLLLSMLYLMNLHRLIFLWLVGDFLHRKLMKLSKLMINISFFVYIFFRY